MAVRIGKYVLGKVKTGPGRPATGDVLVKKGTKETGKQGGKDVREKS